MAKQFILLTSVTAQGQGGPRDCSKTSTQGLSAIDTHYTLMALSHFSYHCVFKKGKREYKNLEKHKENRQKLHTDTNPRSGLSHGPCGCEVASCLNPK